MTTNLFLVGAPKTGSTSLYHYLAEHPQIFMCEDKEPHFFCTDFHEQCIKHHNGLIKFSYTSLTEYNALFAAANDLPIIGEASTSYLYSCTAAENIYRFNPNAKIIVLLRNPIELMHSWYNYMKYTSEEPAKTFEEALHLEAKRKEDTRTVPKTVWYPARVFYRDLVQFDKQLTHYFDSFGHENVKVLLTEDLNESPISVYNEVLEFLGLAPYTPNFSLHNVYREIRFKKLKWFVDNYLRKFKNFIKRNPDSSTLRILGELYTKAMSHDSARPTINIVSRQHLEDELYSVVQRTGALVNQDLSKKWGFT